MAAEVPVDDVRSATDCDPSGLPAALGSACFARGATAPSSASTAAQATQKVSGQRADQRPRRPSRRQTFSARTEMLATPYQSAAPTARSERKR